MSIRYVSRASSRHTLSRKISKISRVSVLTGSCGASSAGSRGCGKLRDGRVQLSRVEAVIFLLRNFRPVSLGAGFDEGGNAQLRDLGLQLQRLFQILLLREHNARRRLARALADLGYVLQIVRNERHKRPPVFSFSVARGTENVKSLVRASEKQQKIFVSMKYTAKQEHRSAAANFCLMC